MPEPAMSADLGDRRAELYTRVERLVEWPMMILAFAFAIAAVIEEVSQVTEEQIAWLAAIQWVVWAVFLVEYVGLLILAPNRVCYLRTHVLELLALLAPMLRVLRLGRSLRFVRLLRAAPFAARFVSGCGAVFGRRGVVYVLVASTFLVLLGAYLAYEVEATNGGVRYPSFTSALWWAFSTVTTGEYADNTPVTAPGRVVASLILIVGVALYGVITASVAAFFVGQDDAEDDERLRRVEERLEHLTHLLERRLEAGDGMATATGKDE